MKVSGPLVTLGVVAALGAGIYFMNTSQEADPTPSKPATSPATSSVTTAAATPLPSTTKPAPPPSIPAPAPFPAKVDYVGEIPIGNDDVITLSITVDGDQAVAYTCDGNAVESWFAGSAANGAVDLTNKDKTNGLQGRHEGNRVVGTLRIGDQKWDFATATVQEPAGLYVYTDGGVRSSWIVDADGSVTGVQRRADGSTSPAPSLSADGIAVIDGRSVTAIRVEGDSNEWRLP